MNAQKCWKKFNDNSCSKNNHYKNVNCFVINACNHLWNNACSGIGSHHWHACEVRLQTKFHFMRLYPVLSWLIVGHGMFWSLVELDEIVFLGFPSGDLVVYSGFCFTLSPWLGTTDWCYLVLFPYQWDGDNSSNCLIELLGRINKIVSMKGSTWYLVLNKFSVNISHYCFHCAYLLICFQIMI